MLRSGAGSSFLFLTIFCAILIVIVLIVRRKIFTPKIRKLSQLDAITELVGRATEMGRPIHFMPGSGGLTGGDVAPQTIAGLSILGYTAELCAKYGSKMYVTIRVPETQALARDIVQQAYLVAGKPEAFDPNLIVYVAPTSQSYTAGVLGLMNREKIAANIMVGAIWAESIMFSEEAATLGAMQIGGTAHTHQLPFMLACCDYSLIGEELFAAGAYVSKDPIQLGDIVGQDMCKLVTIGLVILGVLATLARSSILLDLLRW
jgi:hypothetical protein